MAGREEAEKQSQGQSSEKSKKYVQNKCESQSGAQGSADPADK